MLPLQISDASVDVAPSHRHANGTSGRDTASGLLGYDNGTASCFRRLFSLLENRGLQELGSFHAIDHFFPIYPRIDAGLYPRRIVLGNSHARYLISGRGVD